MSLEFALALKRTNIPNKFLEKLYSTFFHSTKVSRERVMYMGIALQTEGRVPSKKSCVVCLRNWVSEYEGIDFGHVDFEKPLRQSKSGRQSDM